MQDSEDGSGQGTAGPKSSLTTQAKEVHLSSSSEKIIEKSPSPELSKFKILEGLSKFPMDDGAAVAASMALDHEDWELRHDEDGFTYKLLKRHRLLDPAEAVRFPVADINAEERHRKQRKKTILLKLKCKYKKEFRIWELFSNILRTMQDAADQRQRQLQQLDQTSSSSSLLESQSPATEGTESASGSLIDELLFQAEAQEAVINDFSYLCDIAESMCNAQQGWLTQSYMDLPVWSSSPRELMTSLCNE